MEFSRSEPLTFGLELELQIVDSTTGRLSPSSIELLERLPNTLVSKRFALEATLSTIELNSSVHQSARALEDEVHHLCHAARTAAQALGLDVRGGGTNLTQFWNERVMAPTARAKELEARFGFLPKRFSTYGMHVHVGMPTPDLAIQVANVLQGFCPLFIALAAASPFLQLADTGYAAARPLEPLVYPHGGPLPWLRDWNHFESVTDGLVATGIARSLKDIYWDVRPKPEFGTVEVRVFDTPLSIRKAVLLATLTRSVAGLAMAGMLVLHPEARRFHLQEKVSRFYACRDAMNARLFNPCAGEWMSAQEWLASTLATLAKYTPLPQDSGYIDALHVNAFYAEDHLIMREAWSSATSLIHAEEDTTHALTAYSRDMCRRLLGTA